MRLAFGLAALAAMTTIASCGDDTASPPASDAGGAPDATSLDAGSGLDGAGGEAEADAGSVCDPSKAFGAPSRVPGINHPIAFDFSAGLSENDLVATWSSDRADDGGSNGNYRVYTAKRASAGATFGTPTVIDVLSDETTPGVTVSRDGKRAILTRSASTTGLWISERASAMDAWATPVAWSQSQQSDSDAFLVGPTGDIVYFYHAAKVQRSAWNGTDWSAPVEQAVTTPTPNLLRVAVTDDELTMYVGSTTPAGAYDVFVARRASTDAPWGDATIVNELARPFPQWPTWISKDGCVLWFGSIFDYDADAQAGNFDIWMASRQ